MKLMKNYAIKPIPRMFEQVVKQIIEYIDSNQLAVGTKLPTERQLSEVLGVSRSSIREGIKVLELLHYLESKQGGGTFVSSPSPFLIPKSLLGETLQEKELDDYFEVSIMSGERIILNFLEKSVPLPNEVYAESFWENLYKLYFRLGEEISNSHLSSLLKETYILLNNNDYFLLKEPPYTWEEFYHTIEEGDVCKIQKAMHNVTKGT
jgi:GntR family transcriptional regulator, transcriptional repressor for pyruvate dehydrogenase complex